MQNEMKQSQDQQSLEIESLSNTIDKLNKIIEQAETASSKELELVVSAFHSYAAKVPLTDSSRRLSEHKNRQ